MQFKGPFDPEISPDGRRVAYTYYWQYTGYDPYCNPSTVPFPRLAGRSNVSRPFTVADDRSSEVATATVGTRPATKTATTPMLVLRRPTWRLHRRLRVQVKSRPKNARIPTSVPSRTSRLTWRRPAECKSPVRGRQTSSGTILWLLTPIFRVRGGAIDP